ncbi:hypothetical protein MNEG_9786 [Monoraphidium neglectum]|uniref:Major facilitator superfamily associated domain-containing protein n=1 Tax=Monoraphidium neglectum TaxID=145388 RepID=A0A0D2JFD7_9CHLO|nr:hypothetical protein MNEG_9786 [Monoraphidium neglectum]KIY98177.1 hypothetical protein MNEG_9786 [Monoraphidium neglectum]|eukprot:XP_013897197.1 hypothetical protein MNEG_9786 [Monoraphidium neglectum]
MTLRLLCQALAVRSSRASTKVWHQARVAWGPASATPLTEDAVAHTHAAPSYANHRVRPWPKGSGALRAVAGFSSSAARLAHLCQVDSCSKQPTFNFEGASKGLFCKPHAAPGMVNVVSRRCREPGCSKQPHFNFEGESTGIFCKAHAAPGMINVGSRRCREHSCRKQPHFNFEGESKGIFCKAHAAPGMVNVVSRRCREPGCMRHPHFSFEGESSGLFCKAHAAPGMADVTSPRCRQPDCATRPNFNFEGQSRGIFCKTHAAPGMVDVVERRCQQPGCTKRPCYNFQGQSKGIFCKAHAAPGMVDVKKPRCREPGCTKRPVFNFKGESRGIFCKAHSEPGMVDVQTWRCREPGCEKLPSFNHAGHGAAKYCAAHAQPGMVNAVARRSDPNNSGRASGAAAAQPLARAAGLQPAEKLQQQQPDSSDSAQMLLAKAWFLLGGASGALLFPYVNVFLAARGTLNPAPARHRSRARLVSHAAATLRATTMHRAPSHATATEQLPGEQLPAKQLPGLTPAEIGLISALRPWVAAPTSIAATALADRAAAHRPLLLLGLCASALLRAALPLGRGAWELCAILLAAEAFGFFGVLGDSTVLSNLAGREGGAASYGAQRVWASIGWGVFGVAGGAAIQRFGIETAPFVGFGLLSALLFVVGALMRYNYAGWAPAAAPLPSADARGSGGGGGPERGLLESPPAAAAEPAAGEAAAVGAPAAAEAGEYDWSEGGSLEGAAAGAEEGGVAALLLQPEVAIFLFEATMLGFGMVRGCWRL